MTTDELARVALKCRNAQRAYSYTRSNSALQKKKRMERILDRCVAMVLDGQKDLFPKQDVRGGI